MKFGSCRRGSVAFGGEPSGAIHGHHRAGRISPVAGAVRSNDQRSGLENGNGIAQIKEPPNNGMQLTKAARCAPFFHFAHGGSR